MRLLNVHTLEFEEFYHDNIESLPRYIIASHRWGRRELKYKDVVKKRHTDSPGHKKIEGFCKTIRESGTGVDWLWIDTVCIDQRSSSELTESINSMFRWYANAECCLAYLGDVVATKDKGSNDQEKHHSTSFGRSKWFARGWTLQELIAPRLVIFFDQTWQVIGHKGQTTSNCDPLCFASNTNLTSLISQISGIPNDVLRDCEKRKACSVEEKMSWMTNRRTTRVEDLAYCLLGIFEVFMPLVYGEGDQSRHRLLKEIVAKKEMEQPQRETSSALPGHEIDRQLCSEEKALDLSSRVSRLMRRRGYSKDDAVFHLALKDARERGVQVEQAREEIEQYLNAFEQHAAWTKYQYRSWRKQGLPRATAIRRMEAELCRCGYNVLDAHRSLKARLWYERLPQEQRREEKAKVLEAEGNQHLRVPPASSWMSGNSGLWDETKRNLVPEINVFDYELQEQQDSVGRTEHDAPARGQARDTAAEDYAHNASEERPIAQVNLLRQQPRTTESTEHLPISSERKLNTGAPTDSSREVPAEHLQVGNTSSAVSQDAAGSTEEEIIAKDSPALILKVPAQNQAGDMITPSMTESENEKDAILDLQPPASSSTESMAREDIGNAAQPKDFADSDSSQYRADLPIRNAPACRQPLYVSRDQGVPKTAAIEAPLAADSSLQETNVATGPEEVRKDMPVLQNGAIARTFLEAG
ncbi:hypothetical protein CKM354_001039100 [Cercospora kikuchii]|uniref:Heterokaryon incompatibility domain-containing protein n=1 Tax=Cercospora kikuchii TaxID=84275 RepID=A0A9P3FH89_9PEZI|nr:uncharacterized protein CKM354_001039100 [Cercospora kikuchii]GIZ47296.1 hypothetical protein CKM354_001039100 [Cercospora kikuchii]